MCEHDFSSSYRQFNVHKKGKYHIYKIWKLEDPMGFDCELWSDLKKLRAFGAFYFVSTECDDGRKILKFDK